ITPSHSRTMAALATETSHSLPGLEPRKRWGARIGLLAALVVAGAVSVLAYRNFMRPTRPTEVELPPAAAAPQPTAPPVEGAERAEPAPAAPTATAVDSGQLPSGQEEPAAPVATAPTTTSARPRKPATDTTEKPATTKPAPTTTTPPKKADPFDGLNSNPYR
ncbi:MAG TPA: hypothetical protein VLC09_10715, partial [Polyangiaceae bacterium]|nr:hypothetical protein [Polyangiaceae bacterium]